MHMTGTRCFGIVNTHAHTHFNTDMLVKPSINPELGYQPMGIRGEGAFMTGAAALTSRTLIHTNQVNHVITRMHYTPSIY